MDKSFLGQIRMMRGEHHMCVTGKTIYDKKGAASARNLRMKRSHMKLRIYHCDDCNGWHLTKSV